MTRALARDLAVMATSALVIVWLGTAREFFAAIHDAITGGALAGLLAWSRAVAWLLT